MLLAGYTNYFFWTMILASPGSSARRSRAAAGSAFSSATRTGRNHVGLSVFLFDSDALVTPHLARVIGHDSPMFHLRRHGEDGMYDRFAGHAEELWERGIPYAFDQPRTTAGSR
ncbi:hypothetical protein AB0F18_12705 [Streptomyces sp. NPDC029216]|uniref:hypothetical protein n=1 Tax=Streptomyces sp. NPDC029216 TaxID=3154701 RepID=UPI0033EDDD79